MGERRTIRHRHLRLALGLLLAACSPAPTAVPSATAELAPGSPPASIGSPQAGTPASATPLPPATPPPSPTVAPIQTQVQVVLPFNLPGAHPNAEAALYAIDSLWVPLHDSPHGWLLRLDASSGELQAKIPIGESPSSIVIDDGTRNLWVANDAGDGSRHYAGQNTITRFDLRTGRVAGSVKVEIGGPMVVGFGALWVPGYQNGTGNGTLQKIDTSTGKVVARWALAGLPVVGCGRLWVIRKLIGLDAPNVMVVSMVDPETGQRIGEWPVITDGVEGPVVIDGSCRLVRVMSQEAGTMGIGLVNTADGSVGPATATVQGPVRVFGGELWATLDANVFAPLAANGSPAGTSVALPVQATANGDASFMVAGGQGWVITDTRAFRLDWSEP